LSHRLPYPANKGEKIRTFNQIKLLADLGHQITVFSPIDNSKDYDFLTRFNKLNNIEGRLFLVLPKPLRLLKGLMFRQSLSEANFFSIDMYRTLKSHINENTYDAIVCSSSAVAKYIFELKKEIGEKRLPLLLMDFMDLDSDKWQQYSENCSWPMSWLYKREGLKVSELEKKAQSMFDACYFISEPEVSLFKTKYKSDNLQYKNLKILGNGLDTQEFYPIRHDKTVDKAGITLLFTGVMNYKPNVDAVIWFVENCWGKIKRTLPQARFIVVGMNPTAEIEKLKSKPGIEVTGFVDEVLPYYHQADIFVAPFRLARGVQNKVLQAFACGLPVVTTPMGAEGIKCSDGEHLILAETAEQFIEKVIQLEANIHLREHLGTKALALIESDFSWFGKLKPMLEDLGLNNAVPPSRKLRSEL